MAVFACIVHKDPSKYKLRAKCVVVDISLISPTPLWLNWGNFQTVDSFLLAELYYISGLEAFNTFIDYFWKWTV